MRSFEGAIAAVQRRVRRLRPPDHRARPTMRRGFFQLRRRAAEARERFVKGRRSGALCFFFGRHGRRAFRRRERETRRLPASARLRLTFCLRVSSSKLPGEARVITRRERRRSTRLFLFNKSIHVRVSSLVALVGGAVALLLRVPLRGVRVRVRPHGLGREPRVSPFDLRGLRVVTPDRPPEKL
jgi:hypothetical protein